MEFNDKEILLLYKPHVKKDKNTFTLAKQVSEHINDINVLKQPLSETYLREILMLLKVPVEKLIERESDVFKTQFKGKDLDEAGWIQALCKNPDMIKTPIAFKGKQGMIVETPSNVLRLDPKEGFNDLDQ